MRVRLLLVVALGCVPDRQLLAQKLYWLDLGAQKIQRADLNGANIEDVIAPDVLSPGDIAIDADMGKIYWTDSAPPERVIRRANLDGSQREEIMTGANFGGIALDLSAGQIYWTQNSAGFKGCISGIRRARLDGLGAETVLAADDHYCIHRLALDVPGGKMYFTSAPPLSDVAPSTPDGRVHRANLDGSNVETLVTGQSIYPEGIALDTQAGKIYWADRYGNRIQRANFNGTSVETIIDRGVPAPVAIAVDVVNGTLYTASQYGDDGIYRANLDGSGLERLPYLEASANGIALDVVSKLIYWTDTSPGAIQRAGLDGSKPEVILQQEVRLFDSLTLDPPAGKMYWLSLPRAEVQRANLDGSAIDTLPAVDVDYPSTVAVDSAAGKVYWADPYPGAMLRANLDGSQRETLIANTFENADDLAFDPHEGALYWSNGGRIQSARPDGTGLREVLQSRYYTPQIALNPNTGYLYVASGYGIGRTRLTKGSLEPVVTPLLSRPGLLSLDLVNRKIYWADLGPFFGIRRASLDGTMVETVTPSDLPGGLALDLAGGKIYWTSRDASAIRRANLDGSSIEDLVPDVNFAQGIALDPLTQKIYWTESGRVRRADIDGGNVQEISVAGLELPGGIAVDPGGRKVYWVDRGRSRIQRADLDSLVVENVVTTDLVSPTGITLDLTAGKVYWTDPGAGRIERANLDGSRIQHLIRDGLNDPTGIGVDPVTSQVYWTDPSMGKIQRANWVGTNRVDLIANHHGSVRGLAVDDLEDKIYWSDWEGPHVILRCNGDGSDVDGLVSADSYYVPQAIVVDPLSKKLYWVDDFPAQILRANTDGSSIEVLYASENFECGYSDLTVAAGALHWLELCYSQFGVSYRMRRANLDGTDVVDLGIPNLRYPQGLAVDEANGTLYWADAFGSQLRRADLDGRNPHEIIRRLIGRPQHLSLDTTNSRMYWTDANFGTIQRANLDGSGLELVVDGVIAAGGVAVDASAEHLYWAETVYGEPTSRGYIRRAHLDGTAVEDLVALGERTYPEALAVDVHGKGLFWSQIAYVPGGYSYTVHGAIRRADLDGENISDVATGLSFPNSLAIQPSPHIASSLPPDCDIHAQAPFDRVNPGIPFGRRAMEIRFSGPLMSLEVADLAISTTSVDGAAPVIQGVTLHAPDVATVTFAPPEQPGAWTCLQHPQSGTHSCLGFLPGDVSGDRASLVDDVSALIACLKSPDGCTAGRCDLDDSGQCTPLDLMEEIDLLLGASPYAAWLGQSLPECP